MEGRRDAVRGIFFLQKELDLDSYGHTTSNKNPHVGEGRSARRLCFGESGNSVLHNDNAECLALKPASGLRDCCVLQAPLPKSIAFTIVYATALSPPRSPFPRVRTC